MFILLPKYSISYTKLALKNLYVELEDTFLKITCIGKSCVQFLYEMLFIFLAGKCLLPTPRCFFAKIVVRENAVQIGLDFPAKSLSI